MSKAYDIIELSYLEHVMTKLGFNPKWINLIMMCVSSVSYYFLVDGSPRGYVLLTQGLRPGDPISPYLFLCCAEGLSSLIAKKENAGVIQGISICLLAPPVNHLLFDDDSFIFSRAKWADCENVRDILACYERVSGQQVNLAKSAICFSRNVKRNEQGLLGGLLGVERVERHKKYLGLPTFVGRNCGTCFNHIKEKLWKKLQGWKSKIISAAGKELLVKVIAQTIPLYSMYCFLLPKYFYNELNQIMASYWWKESDNGKKIHWMAWEKLCLPKSEGGLGFRNLYAFNLALLAKQGWRIISDTTSLVARTLKAKYFPNSSFLDAVVRSNASYVWRSICSSIEVIKRGSRW